LPYDIAAWAGVLRVLCRNLRRGLAHVAISLERFMIGDFRDSNPYASPNINVSPSPEPQRRVQGRVVAPAIALMTIASVGLALSLFNVGWALTKHEIDPRGPDIMQQVQKGAVGALAATVQGGFVLLNLLILLGGIQMFRFRTWGLAVAASGLAMVNFGSCCCLPGIPIGIWSLVILLMPEVRAAFQMVEARTI
jgi:hypothetical protein